ncbi:MAG: dTDP-4-dehydrorhamnose 3,5-epimerase [Rhodocyclaceae bacterium]|nr:dTDP-4-dehydrorhamnose 3,5-epimerase [Rhodocyclaceae bacterium]MDZ4215938.1 dTDP-4-dehydrorhamnose 3,5-epimerase [Rhodocyclaceae bacterium]
MNQRFDLIDTILTGLKLLQRKPIGDNRGYLDRMFCTEELEPLLAGQSIVQVNHTLTAACGTVRGLHFQYPPHAETKFVSCLRGEVFDVAVDLRRDSPTFLRWHGEILSADNHRTLMIPKGYAHGFQTLSDNCEMLYFHTAAYHAESEGGLHPLDARLDIAWPLTVKALSLRDSSHPLINNDFLGVSP